MNNTDKINSIDFVKLFDEVQNCRWKEELVNTYARYGIKDYTKKTGVTKRTHSDGKSSDLYASFKTPDDENNVTHIFFEVNKIKINTNEVIAYDPYFSHYEILDNPNDGSYKNKCFSIAYNVDEFKYVMSYFLGYDYNWLDRIYDEIEPVRKIDFNETVKKEKDEVLQEHLKNISEIIDKEIDQLQVNGEEKHVLTKIRVNQSIFRELLLKKYSHCCLCNVDNQDLLIASHIKPWAKSSSKEKLDVNNGLLLCPNHDKLFDKGYITFDDNGNIHISDRLSDNNLTYMNITNTMHINLTEENRKYMEYHRNMIFVKR